MHIMLKMHKRCRQESDSRLKVKTPFPCTASFFNCIPEFQFSNMNAKGYKICLSVHYVKRLKLSGD